MSELNLDDIIAKAALFDEMLPALQDLLDTVCQAHPVYTPERAYHRIISTKPGEQGILLHRSYSFTACLEWLAQRAKSQKVNDNE